MKILVTGGAGYIGSHTVRLLVEQGFEVTVLDNLENGHRESLPDNVKLVEADLREDNAIDRLFADNDFAGVIHFAAYIEAGESMKKPLKFFNNNTRGTINLLSAMVNHGVKNIIFSSTAAVYGEPIETPIEEDHPTLPTNYYGESKLMSEKIMRIASKTNGINSIILRYFNASGAGFDIGEDHDPETHLIPLILQVAQGMKDSITLFGNDYPTDDGTCVRDYVHVLDLAKAHVLALHAILNGKTGTFNLGTGTGYSVKEVLTIARDITRHPIPAKNIGRREGDPAILVASSEKARTELGWEPEYSLRDIIGSAWEWHRNNPDGFRKKSKHFL